MQRSLRMLSEGGAYLTNIVQAASDRQIVRDAGDTDAALELKWNHQFGPDDVQDMKSILGLLSSARDSAAVDRARRAIRSELERTPALLAPFAAEKLASAELAESRQRVGAMLAAMRQHHAMRWSGLGLLAVLGMDSPFVPTIGHTTMPNESEPNSRPAACCGGMDWALFCSDAVQTHASAKARGREGFGELADLAAL